MNESEKTLHISPPKHIEWAAVAVLSVLGLFLLVETVTAFNSIGRSELPPSNVITVNGEGEVNAAPDIAQITFTVMNTSPTVAAAQEKTTTQGNAALEYLEGKGIDTKDVKTLSYNVSPQYAYPNPCQLGVMCPAYSDNAPKITGYQVSQTVQVKVRDLDAVGDLLGGLGKQNIQNISGPDFTLDDLDAVQNEARAEAIVDAKAKAKELAKQLGVRLVRIVNYSEGGNYPIYAKYGLGMGGDMMSEAASVPNLPVGENEYSSNVMITYEIR